jgi:hypothetical protein
MKHVFEIGDLLDEGEGYEVTVREAEGGLEVFIGTEEWHAQNDSDPIILRIAAVEGLLGVGPTDTLESLLKERGV